LRNGGARCRDCVVGYMVVWQNDNLGEVAYWEGLRSAHLTVSVCGPCVRACCRHLQIDHGHQEQKKILADKIDVPELPASDFKRVEALTSRVAAAARGGEGEWTAGSACSCGSSGNIAGLEGSGRSSRCQSVSDKSDDQTRFRLRPLPVNVRTGRGLSSQSGDSGPKLDSRFGGEEESTMGSSLSDDGLR
jgi:hypothetical protein